MLDAIEEEQAVTGAGIYVAPDFGLLYDDALVTSYHTATATHLASSTSPLAGDIYTQYICTAPQYGQATKNAANHPKQPAQMHLVSW